MTDVVTTTDYWRVRHEAYAPGTWVQDYWDGWQSPRRQALADVMASFAPFASVLEPGACCGPNLRLWRSRWPEPLLLGLELNAEAVAFGQQQFAADPMTALWQGNIREAVVLPHVDLVVACGFFSSIEPPAVRPLLDMLWAATIRALIILDRVSPTGYCGRDPEAGLAWFHDYPIRLARLHPPGARWAQVPISPQEQIFIAEKAA